VIGLWRGGAPPVCGRWPLSAGDLLALPENKRPRRHHCRRSRARRRAHALCRPCHLEVSGEADRVVSAARRGRWGWPCVAAAAGYAIKQKRPDVKMLMLSPDAVEQAGNILRRLKVAACAPQGLDASSATRYRGTWHVLVKGITTKGGKSLFLWFLSHSGGLTSKFP
jgi:hypothetical protein